MVKNIWKLVQRVVDEADVILEVIDARFPEETRNPDVERTVRKRHKPLVFVLNKADLLQKPFAAVKFSGEPAVFVGATKNLGTTKLRRVLRSFIKSKPITIGIVGYPNTGKSSLINVLKQRKSAPTSPVAGFTKGIQLIKIDKMMYMLDTPGIFSPDDFDKVKHALTGVVSVAQMKDPDVAALRILEKIGEENARVLEEAYGVAWRPDLDGVLEALALHFHFLLKGGKPDVQRMGRKLVEDWQSGKLQ